LFATSKIVIDTYFMTFYLTDITPNGTLRWRWKSDGLFTNIRTRQYTREKIMGKFRYLIIF